jgi:tape measure domain-containing protein
MSEPIQTGVRVYVDLGNSVGNAQNFAKVISQVGKTATSASAEFKKSAQEISANARSISDAMGMNKPSQLAKSALEASRASLEAAKSLGMLGASARNTEVQIKSLTSATEKYVAVSSKLGMQTKAVGMQAQALMDYTAAWNKLSEIGMKRMAGSEWAAKLSTASTPTNLPILPKAEGESQVSLLSRLKAGWMGIAGAVVAAKAALSSVKGFISLADEYSGLIARTKLVSGTQKELKTAMDATYQIALNTRAPLKEVTQLYYRMSVAMAGAGKSQQETIAMTDLVTKSLKISGASSTETAAALQQFSQAMQAGVLNGDEFRSVMENMPRLVTALTTSLGVDIATLREWSSQGKLTFEVITNALASQQEAIDRDFKKIPITVEGALTNLRTAAAKWLGDADQAAQGSKKFADAINSLALNFNTLVEPLANIGSSLLELGSKITPLVVKGFDNIKTAASSLKTELDAIDEGFSNKINKDLVKFQQMAQGKWALPEPTPGMGPVGPQLPQGRDEYFSGRAKAAAKQAEDDKALLKAQEQAQKVLEANIRQRIETERQAAELFKAQAETRIKALEAERDQMESNFKLELDSAVTFQQKETINANLVKARQDSLRKEYEIKQDIFRMQDMSLNAIFDAYSEELAKAKELGLKDEEIIALKTTLLGLQNEAKLLNETSAQQQIDLNEQLRKASEQAIESKNKEKQVTNDVVLEYQKELDLFLKLSAAKAAGATTEQLGVMKSVYERTQGLEGSISKEQLANLQQYLISIEALKSATGELAGKEKDVREEALRMLEVMNSNLEYAQEVAKGLTEAFDSVGAAIGGMAVAMAEYGKQQVAIEVQKQEEIKKAAGDPGKIAQAEMEASQKSAKAQIKSYGDITQAAQGFFKKGTAGYQAMGTAVKVFRAFEMAQSVMSAMKQIDQMGGLLTAFTASLTQMGILSDANAAKEATNSTINAQRKAIEGAANQGSSGDPYSAFARVAAWVALMAGLGIAISGGASAAPTMTGKDYAKQQEEAFSASLGSTVLGGAEASESIQNSLDILVENSTADLDYSRGLRKAFEDLAAAMTGLAAAVAASFKVNLSGLNLGKTTKYNYESSFGIAKEISNVDPIMNFLAKAIFGSTKVKRELAGQGIELLGQNLGKILEKGIVKGTQYADILVTTKKSAFFGLISSTKQTIETITSQIPKPINDALVKVFQGVKDTLIKAAGNLGVGGTSFEEALGKSRINLGRIPFGSDAKKNAELLNKAINKYADLTAMKMIPAYKDSQQVGEGYLETLTRVANAITNGTSKLAQFNIRAISYNQVMNKKGDIEKQIVIQSVLASNATSDLKDVIAGLPGTADDAIAALDNLFQIRDLFNSTGQASVKLSDGLILASGGIDKLKTNLQTYFDRFFTDSEKLASNTNTLSGKFAQLGLTMPSISESFDTATGKVVTAKEGYRAFVESLKNDTSEAGVKLYSFALDMAGTFADAVDLNMTVLQNSIDSQIQYYRLLGNTEKATTLERQKALLSLTGADRNLAIAMYALSDATDAAKKATDNQIAVYKLLGDTEKVTSLERAKALSTMTQADKATAQSLYDLEDALNAAKKATDNQIAVYKLLGDTEKVISLERKKALSTMSDADKAMAQTLYDLEDALDAAKNATDNQIAVYKLLGDTEKVTSLERTKALLVMSDAAKAMAQTLYDLEDALLIAKNATDNQIAVYKLLGDTEKVTSLERAKALSTMTDADKAMAQTLYDLEDALLIAKNATDNQIAVYKLLGDTETVISLERQKALSAMSDADKAMAQTLYDLEDAVNTINESTNNQIAIYKLLGEQDPAAKERALALEREKAMAGMDASTRQFTIVVNNLTDANTALSESSSALQTAYDNLTNMRDAFVNLGQGIRDYYNELTGAQSPNLTPEARYTAAKTAFTEVSALAAQGIQSALGDLPTVAKEFLAVSREFNASGPTYQADFASVLTALQSGMSAADRQIEIMNKQLAEAEKSNANLLKVDASTSTVNSSITALQVAIAGFNTSLVNYNTATQSAVAEAIRQASAGSAASGVVAGAGPQADAAKAAADAAAAQAAADAKAKADAAKATADAAAAQAAADAKAKADAAKAAADADAKAKADAAKAAADAAAAAAAAQAEKQRQAAIAAAAAAAAEAERQRREAAEAAAAAMAAAEAERQRQAAAAAAAAEAERQRQAAAEAERQRQAAAAAERIATAKGYSSSIATYIRTRNFDSAKIIRDRATAAGYAVVQTKGAGTAKRSDDVYTVDGYAKGGYATPGMALVGEQGPELVNFASPGQVYTAGQTQNILSAGSDNQKKQTEAAEQQVAELQALVKIQQTASIEMIRELKALKAEMATLTRKAKLEAAS